MTQAVAGYVADVAYPARFHREQMPVWLHSTAAALGYASLAPLAGYRWLELGCAAGTSALVAAACHPQARFTAVDVDAAQIAHARAQAQSAGLDNIDFIATDLRDETLLRGEPVDCIVSHGVWSWVASAVRDAMLSIVRARLRPGGLLALGYMSHPGASPLQAVHRLMREHARSGQGDTAERARAATALLQRLATAGAGFFAEHPGARRQVQAMQGEMPEYLAHEFLGEHWEPQHAAAVIAQLAGVDCDFIGSATPLENIDILSVPAGIQPLLRELPPGPLAETVRDLARNQSLRRDLYQRRAQPLSASEHLQALDALVYAAMPGAPAGGALQFDTRIGPVPGPVELFDPLLATLARGPASFASLRALPVFANAPGLLNQAMQMLIWAGLAHPLRAEHDRGPAPVPVLPGLQLLPQAGTAIARPAP